MRFPGGKQTFKGKKVKRYESETEAAHNRRYFLSRTRRHGFAWRPQSLLLCCFLMSSLEIKLLQTQRRCSCKNTAVTMRLRWCSHHASTPVFVTLKSSMAQTRTPSESFCQHCCVLLTDGSCALMHCGAPFLQEVHIILRVNSGFKIILRGFC